MILDHLVMMKRRFLLKLLLFVRKRCRSEVKGVHVKVEVQKKGLSRTEEEILGS